MEVGKVVRDGPAEELLADEDIREFYLGSAVGHRAALVRRGQELPEEEAMERVTTEQETPAAQPAADLPRESPAPLLEVRDLTLRFGGVTALNGVSFTVGRGELFAVIGPNGAGKTSIFNCLNGVYRPQQGTITLGWQADHRPLARVDRRAWGWRGRSRTSACSRTSRSSRTSCWAAIT